MHQRFSFKTRINEFCVLLDKIQSAELEMSAYSRRYLSYLLRHRYYFLHIYAHVLDSAALRSKKPFEEVNLVDYGAGNGLLGMFAKYCGCNKVFLCDTAKNFIDASIVTAARLEINIDGYIHGDLDALEQKQERENIHWIIGTDVIEHIYDLDCFFKRIKILNPEMITVFTTASNPDNYFKATRLKKMQMHDELTGGQPTDFELAGEEAHPPYLQMRKDIISEYDPGMTEPELSKMAALTRGKIKGDILEAVNKWKISRQWPSPPGGHNTCHPITGSWSERLLPFSEYQKIYSHYNFNLQVINGFYDSYSPGYKRRFYYFVNTLIKIMGKKIAPFITLVGY